MHWREMGGLGRSTRTTPRTDTLRLCGNTHYKKDSSVAGSLVSASGRGETRQSEHDSLEQHAEQRSIRTSLLFLPAPDTCTFRPPPGLPRSRVFYETMCRRTHRHCPAPSRTPHLTLLL
ncbi:hypothetical protein OBBRIDRAFT_107916 [Obba rivulosa]|uniref:Uncharacterized protein n=1 Tax=Obba rivulosa TaxID=1052685 RepID=A0A8E2DML5_9APHY|nr:hypothetical protein OBBRIDRAFT_107916 [Obba rivulosa]